MHELLRALPSGARVLDLGCAGGSFESGTDAFAVVRIDLERGARPPSNFVQADAARLPFPAACFDVLISNHSLEHIDDLTSCLEEIGRVMKPGGALYIAVPDASTVSDRLYRWLARGGGHINAFSSHRQLADRVQNATGLRHVATRTLFSSLSCLNRRNRRASGDGTRAPRRLWLIGGGTATSLHILNGVFRLADRFLHTRWSVYGWAFYFGKIDAPIDCGAWSNVCIGCGAGHASGWLRSQNLVRRRFLMTSYRCPVCGSANLFTDDRHYQNRS